METPDHKKQTADFKMWEREFKTETRDFNDGHGAYWPVSAFARYRLEQRFKKLDRTAGQAIPQPPSAPMNAPETPVDSSEPDDDGFDHA